MRAFGILLVFGLAATLSGCGLLAQRSSWDPFASRSERELSVRVQNRTTQDVNVNVMAGGRREPLGRVEGRQQERYSVSWQRTETVRFQLEPIAGRRLTISGGVASPGDHLDLYLEEPLSRSFVSR